MNDFFSVTYFVTAVVLSFLGTLYSDTDWIGVAYNRMATNELAVTLAIIGSSFGSVPLPHQTRDIRLRWRRTNFAYQNRRRKLSGTRNGSNAIVYSLTRKWFIFKIKGKGKVQRRTVHEGPEGSRGITPLFFLNRSARWGGWSTSRPGRFTSGNNPVPIVWGWVGPRARMDGCGKSRAHRRSIPRLSVP